MLDPCKACGYGPIEWVDLYCQQCWEALCSREWWQMIAALEAEDNAVADAQDS